MNEPHTGIVGVKGNYALNMVSRLSGDARGTILDLVHQDVNKVIRDWALVRAMMRGDSTILTYLGKEPPKYYNPYISGAFRPYTASINEDAIKRARDANDFKDLLLVRGFGPSTMLALALIAELIYRSPVDWMIQRILIQGGTPSHLAVRMDHHTQLIGRFMMPLLT